MLYEAQRQIVMQKEETDSLERFLARTKQMIYLQILQKEPCILAEDSLFLSDTSNPLVVLRDLLPTTPHHYQCQIGPMFSGKEPITLRPPINITGTSFPCTTTLLNPE